MISRFNFDYFIILFAINLLFFHLLFSNNMTFFQEFDANCSDLNQSLLPSKFHRYFVMNLLIIIITISSDYNFRFYFHRYSDFN